MSDGTIYNCSDSQCCDGQRYFGDVDLWAKLESGEWELCCWDDESGEEWVETEDGTLLALRPVSRDAVPETVILETVSGGVSVTSSPDENS